MFVEEHVNTIGLFFTFGTFVTFLTFSTLGYMLKRKEVYARIAEVQQKASDKSPEA
jgi:hypothetical protein